MTYEYLCTSCSHQWEQEQRITEPAETTCPACNQKTAKRLISKTAFILNGGGWASEGYNSK